MLYLLGVTPARINIENKVKRNNNNNISIKNSILYTHLRHFEFFNISTLRLEKIS